MGNGTMAPDGLEERLRAPLVPREPGVFRLGLVLNGTVSAGAWTAGVLDFMVEALDLWEDEKREDRAGGGAPTIPDHALRLGVVGGASGGGVCAALLARAAAWRFPHVTDPDDPANGSNPFWRVWVDELDIGAMLGTDDLAGPGAVPASLLSDAAIEAAGEVILSWPGPEASRLRRAWLADPLRVILTLTNLRGVPYRIDFAPDGRGNPRSSHHVDHADHALFAVSPGGRDPARLGLRGDESLLRSDADWRRFAAFAKATGAFPGGMPPRTLSRPTSDYLWRGVALPGASGARPDIALRVPAWDALPGAARPGETYSFECVDGGALNNQPVELVRTALSGLGEMNPRDPREADTAVLLLDPFAATPGCEPPGGQRDLLGVLGGLAAAWTGHGRLATSDLLLALRPDVFSRFVLSANRERDGLLRHGGEALATSGLSAFLGFLHRDLRAHDYVMGRDNCRAFLMDEFVLHEANPVFGGFARRHPGVAERYRPGARGPGWMPIIPVAERLRGERGPPPWPRGALDPADLRPSIDKRIGLVLRRLLDARGIDVPFEGLIVNWLLADKLAGVAEAKIRRALEGEDLA